MFTNWDDAAPFGVYDVCADVTSWDHTGSFLSKLFAAKASPPTVKVQAPIDVPDAAPEEDDTVSDAPATKPAPEGDSPTDSPLDALADKSSAFVQMMTLPAFIYAASSLGSLYLV